MDKIYEIGRQKNFTLVEGVLFDLPTKLYTNDGCLTLELLIADEPRVTFTNICDLIAYVKNKFNYLEHLEFDGVRYRKVPSLFFKDAIETYNKNKQFGHFYAKRINAIRVFAEHFSRKGTLNKDSFIIGNFEFSLSGETIPPDMELFNKNYLSIQKCAAQYRQEASYDIYDDIYYTLEIKLNKIFKTMKNLHGDFLGFKCGSLTVKKIKNDK